MKREGRRKEREKEGKGEREGEREREFVSQSNSVCAQIARYSKLNQINEQLFESVNLSSAQSC